MNAAGNPWPVALLSALLSGTFTGTLTLLGVVVTQRATARREATARQWQQRQAAHADFLQAQKRAMEAAYRWHDDPAWGGADINDIHEDWLASMWDALFSVELVASQPAALAARRLYRATQDAGSGSFRGQANAREYYRRAVQQDLGLPPTNLPDWGEEDDGKWAEIGRG